MSRALNLTINGSAVRMPAGSMVSAAVAAAAISAFRRSATGEPRGALCGMGICYECRVTIDGRPHGRSCQIPCREGMDVRTGT